jgi:hypothetical protein
MSCAQDVKNVPDYDFNRHYDMNEIIKSYESIDRPDVNKILEIIKKDTLIGFSWIDTPIGQVTLFKNENTLCGIRVVSFKRGGDKKAPTSFNSGKESLFAEYEMFTLLLKEKVTSDNKKLVITNGNLSQNATFGLGRLAFGGGNSTIKCGSEKLNWSFPTAISLSSSNSNMKFSATKLKRFSLVDIDSYNDAWYGYEENRKMIILFESK